MDTSGVNMLSEVKKNIELRGLKVGVALRLNIMMIKYRSIDDYIKLNMLICFHGLFTVGVSKSRK